VWLSAIHLLRARSCLVLISSQRFCCLVAGNKTPGSLFGLDLASISAPRSAILLATILELVITCLDASSGTIARQPTRRGIVEANAHTNSARQLAFRCHAITHPALPGRSVAMRRTWQGPHKCLEANVAVHVASAWPVLPCWRSSQTSSFEEAVLSSISEREPCVRPNAKMDPFRLVFSSRMIGAYTIHFFRAAVILSIIRECPPNKRQSSEQKRCHKHHDGRYHCKHYNLFFPGSLNGGNQLGFWFLAACWFHWNVFSQFLNKLGYC